MVLTVKQRLVVKMKREGMPQKEIAARLRCSPANVCKMLGRAENRIIAFVAKMPAIDSETVDALLK